MKAIGKPLDIGVDSLLKETKQMIMDLLIGKHLCVGQICKKLNLDAMIVSGVIYRQIKQHQYIKREVD